MLWLSLGLMSFLFFENGSVHQNHQENFNLFFSPFAFLSTFINTPGLDAQTGLVMANGALD